MMRVFRIEGEVYTKPAYTKKQYFTIWLKHSFAQMHDCDFCWICNHSYKIHLEYGVLK